MVNWYCLIHFPDGTEKVHLVPGPAPIDDNAIITIANVPGHWLVREITTRVPHDMYAAELWVEPSE